MKKKRIGKKKKEGIRGRKRKKETKQKKKVKGRKILGKENKLKEEKGKENNTEIEQFLRKTMRLFTTTLLSFVDISSATH